MKKWFKLMVGITAIYGFIEVAPRVMAKIEIYELIKKSSADRGIDNSTIFYSEEPLSYESEQWLLERLQADKHKGALEK